MCACYCYRHSGRNDAIINELNKVQNKIVISIPCHT